MNKEFVTYEQALTLKELGFDERCFGHYNPNGVFFWKILCSDEDNDHTLSVKDIMEHVADGYVEAPLYQQAFRWFKEKHNIRVWTEWGSEYLCCAMIQYSSGMKECIDCCLNDEEAEQACLDKLIEICKNK